jgi:TM2 domain-containing membrane protein YozV
MIPVDRGSERWSLPGMRDAPLLLRGGLSFLIPGLGQIVSGQGARGACILGLVLIVGNLNAIFLSVYAPTIGLDLPFFARGLPRLLHDVFSFYGVVFWIWQAVDATLPQRPQG